MPTNKARITALAALALLLPCGCVDLPGAQSPSGREPSAVRLPDGFSLGMREQQTLHFIVKAHSQEDAAEYGDLSEKLYQQIMQATGLYSFVPKQSYELVVLADRQEYISKTRAPEWSGGVTVGNAIVVFDSPQVQPIIAHEMTHLVFNEFMERPRRDLTWLNEGLAVSIEKKNYSASQLVGYSNSCSAALRYGGVKLENLMLSTPIGENRTGAEAWYCQANSVVSYLLDKGGGLPFSIFVSKLKNGSTLDQALDIAYNGQWASSAALEKDWAAASGIKINAGLSPN
ncbi:MAG: hypothetical protein GX410_02395 [Elusimicrobia bacterium]|nr:hypothetical protein [Elusimicrobiota bacterium]